MASIYLTVCFTSKTLVVPSTLAAYASSSYSPLSTAAQLCRFDHCRCSLLSMPSGLVGCCKRRKSQSHVVCMAPEEEKLTRRNPLDFPIEWERPKPGRRPDIFPQFSPMKTPLPPPLPCDPPEEDEEDEEKKEEEEENPEKEEPEQPEKE